MPVQPIIPPEWGWAYDVAVGQEWPQADEDALRRLAQAWTDAMESLLTVADGGNVAAQNVNYSVQSVSSDEFNNYWSAYVDGDNSVVGQMAQQCESLATQLLAFAEQTEFTKLSIDIQLILLFIQLVIDLVMAFVTFGASTAEGVVAAFITRLTVRSFLGELLKAVIMAVLPDVITQLVMLSEGHRSSFDWGEAAQAAQMGVIGGLVGYGIGKIPIGNFIGSVAGKMLGEDASKILATDAGKIATGTLIAGLHGGLTNVATNYTAAGADWVENQIHAANDPQFAKELQQQTQDKGYADQKSGENPLIAFANGVFTGVLFHGVHEGSVALAGKAFDAAPLTLLAPDANGNLQPQNFTALPIRDGSGSNYALFDESHQLIGKGAIGDNGAITVTPNKGPTYGGQVVTLGGQKFVPIDTQTVTPDVTTQLASALPSTSESDQPLALGSTGHEGMTPPTPSEGPTSETGPSQPAAGDLPVQPPVETVPTQSLGEVSVQPPVETVPTQSLGEVSVQPPVETVPTQSLGEVSVQPPVETVPTQSLGDLSVQPSVETVPTQPLVDPAQGPVIAGPDVLLPSSTQMAQSQTPVAGLLPGPIFPGVMPESAGTTRLAGYGAASQAPDLSEAEPTANLQSSAKPAAAQPAAPGAVGEVTDLLGETELLAGQPAGEPVLQPPTPLSTQEFNNIVNTPTQLLSLGEARVFTNDREGINYALDTWRRAIDQLKPEQRDALRIYTSDRGTDTPGRPSYLGINGFLRGKVAVTPEILASVDLIDQALRLQPVPENVVVNRFTDGHAFLGRDGRPIDNSNLKELENLVGTVHESPRYLSTHFGAYRPKVEPAALHLLVPEGTPALFLEEISYVPHEHELLLERGLSFQIDRVWHETDEFQRTTWHVQAHVIEDPGLPGAGSAGPGALAVPDIEHSLPDTEFTPRMESYASQPTQPRAEYRGLTPDQIVGHEVTGEEFGSGSDRAQQIGQELSDSYRNTPSSSESISLTREAAADLNSRGLSQAEAITAWKAFYASATGEGPGLAYRYANGDVVIGAAASVTKEWIVIDTRGVSEPLRTTSSDTESQILGEASPQSPGPGLSEDGGALSLGSSALAAVADPEQQVSVVHMTSAEEPAALQAGSGQQSDSPVIEGLKVELVHNGEPASGAEHESAGPGSEHEPGSGHGAGEAQAASGHHIAEQPVAHEPVRYAEIRSVVRKGEHFRVEISDGERTRFMRVDVDKAARRVVFSDASEDPPVLRQMVSRVQTPPGLFDVFSHADENGLLIDGMHVSFDDVARFLPDLPDRSMIRLCGCEAGHGDALAAIATATGHTVLAADTTVWIDKNGNVFAADAHDEGGKAKPTINTDGTTDGRWKLFLPDRTSIDLGPDPRPLSHTPEADDLWFRLKNGGFFQPGTQFGLKTAADLHLPPEVVDFAGPSEFGQHLTSRSLPYNADAMRAVNVTLREITGQAIGDFFGDARRSGYTDILDQQEQSRLRLEMFIGNLVKSGPLSDLAPFKGAFDLLSLREFGHIVAESAIMHAGVGRVRGEMDPVIVHGIPVDIEYSTKFHYPAKPDADPAFIRINSVDGRDSYPQILKGLDSARKIFLGNNPGLESNDFDKRYANAMLNLIRGAPAVSDNVGDLPFGVQDQHAAALYSLARDTFSQEEYNKFDDVLAQARNKLAAGSPADAFATWESAFKDTEVGKFINKAASLAVLNVGLEGARHPENFIASLATWNLTAKGSVSLDDALGYYNILGPGGAGAVSHFADWVYEGKPVYDARLPENIARTSNINREMPGQYRDGIPEKAGSVPGAPGAQSMPAKVEEFFRREREIIGLYADSHDMLPGLKEAFFGPDPTQAAVELSQLRGLPELNTEQQQRLEQLENGQELSQLRGQPQLDAKQQLRLQQLVDAQRQYQRTQVRGLTDVLFTHDMGWPPSADLLNVGNDTSGGTSGPSSPQPHSPDLPEDGNALALGSSNRGSAARGQQQVQLAQDPTRLEAVDGLSERAFAQQPTVGIADRPPVPDLGSVSPQNLPELQRQVWAEQDDLAFRMGQRLLAEQALREAFDRGANPLELHQLAEEAAQRARAETSLAHDLEARQELVARARDRFGLPPQRDAEPLAPALAGRSELDRMLELNRQRLDLNELQALNAAERQRLAAETQRVQQQLEGALRVGVPTDAIEQRLQQLQQRQAGLQEEAQQLAEQQQAVNREIGRPSLRDAVNEVRRRFHEITQDQALNRTDQQRVGGARDQVERELERRQRAAQQGHRVEDSEPLRQRLAELNRRSDQLMREASQLEQHRQQANQQLDNLLRFGDATATGGQSLRDAQVLGQITVETRYALRYKRVLTLAGEVLEEQVRSGKIAPLLRDEVRAEFDAARSQIGEVIKQIDAANPNFEKIAKTLQAAQSRIQRVADRSTMDAGMQGYLNRMLDELADEARDRAASPHAVSGAGYKPDLADFVRKPFAAISQKTSGKVSIDVVRTDEGGVYLRFRRLVDAISYEESPLQGIRAGYAQDLFGLTEIDHGQARGEIFRDPHSGLGVGVAVEANTKIAYTPGHEFEQKLGRGDIFGIKLGGPGRRLVAEQWDELTTAGGKPIQVSTEADVGDLQKFTVQGNVEVHPALFHDALANGITAPAHIKAVIEYSRSQVDGGRVTSSVKVAFEFDGTVPQVGDIGKLMLRSVLSALGVNAPDAVLGMPDVSSEAALVIGPWDIKDIAALAGAAPRWLFEQARGLLENQGVLVDDQGNVVDDQGNALDGQPTSALPAPEGQPTDRLATQPLPQEDVSQRQTQPLPKEDVSQHPTQPPLTGDEITAKRAAISGTGPGGTQRTDLAASLTQDPESAGAGHHNVIAETLNARPGEQEHPLATQPEQPVRAESSHLAVEPNPADQSPSYPLEHRAPVSLSELHTSAHPSHDGVRIAAPGDPIHGMPPIEIKNAFVMEVHGADGQLFLDGHPIKIDPAELREQLIALGWDGVKPIVLASCEAGVDGGAADQLAAALPGTDIIATKALVWRDSHGNIVAASEDRNIRNGRLQPTLVEKDGQLTGDGHWELHRAGAETAELPRGYAVRPTRPELISREADFVDLAGRGIYREGDHLSAKALRDLAGMPEQNQQRVQELVERRKIAIDFRPSNSETARWLERGAIPKPEAIKAKSINQYDVMLAPDDATRAALAEHIGAVGFFKPLKPVDAPEYDANGQQEPRELVRSTQSDPVWDALKKRYASLTREYQENNDALAHLDAEGFFHVADGVVYPYRAEIVNRLDLKLAPDDQVRAALEDSLRKPAYFMPKEPVRTDESAGEWAALQKRFSQRLAEHNRVTGTEKELVASGKATIEAGVVKLSRLEPLQVPEGTPAVDPMLGPPVAGDHDMFNIRGLNGSQLPNLRTETTATGGTIEVFEFKDNRGHVLWQVRIPEGSRITRVIDFDGQPGLMAEVVDSLGNRSLHAYAPNPDVWFEEIANEPGREKWDIPPMPARSGEAIAGDMGIMHGATAYWTPRSAQEIRIYGDIMQEYGRGGDLLIRFQAGHLPTLVHSDTPVISGLLEAPEDNISGLIEGPRISGLIEGPRSNPVAAALNDHHGPAGREAQQPLIEKVTAGPGDDSHRSNASHDSPTAHVGTGPSSGGHSVEGSSSGHEWPAGFREVTVPDHPEWDCQIHVKGRIVIIGDDPELARGTEQAAPDGPLIIKAHGRGGEVFLGHDSPEPMRLTDPAFLRLLTEEASLQPDQSIVLACCEAGLDGGAADRLAAMLHGTTVIAADTAVWDDLNGGLFAAGEKTANGMPVPALLGDENGAFHPDGVWKAHLAGAETVPLPESDPRHPVAPEGLSPARAEAGEYVPLKDVRDDGYKGREFGEQPPDTPLARVADALAHHLWTASITSDPALAGKYELAAQIMVALTMSPNAQQDPLNMALRGYAHDLLDPALKGQAFQQFLAARRMNVEAWYARNDAQTAQNTLNTVGTEITRLQNDIQNLEGQRAALLQQPAPSTEAARANRNRQITALDQQLARARTDLGTARKQRTTASNSLNAAQFVLARAPAQAGTGPRTVGSMLDESAAMHANPGLAAQSLPPPSGQVEHLGVYSIPVNVNWPHDQMPGHAFVEFYGDGDYPGILNGLRGLRGLYQARTGATGFDERYADALLDLAARPPSGQAPQIPDSLRTLAEVLYGRNEVRAFLSAPDWSRPNSQDSHKIGTFFHDAAALMVLEVGLEGARNPTALVTNLMTWDMAAHGVFSLDRALGYLNVMGAPGSVRAGSASYDFSGTRGQAAIDSAAQDIASGIMNNRSDRQDIVTSLLSQFPVVRISHPQFFSGSDPLPDEATQRALITELSRLHVGQRVAEMEMRQRQILALYAATRMKGTVTVSEDSAGLAALQGYLYGNNQPGQPRKAIDQMANDMILRLGL